MSQPILQPRMVAYYDGYAGIFREAIWYYRPPITQHGLHPDEHPSVAADREWQIKYPVMSKEKEEIKHPVVPKKKAVKLKKNSRELLWNLAVKYLTTVGTSTSVQIGQAIGHNATTVHCALSANRTLFRIAGQSTRGFIWRLK